MSIVQLYDIMKKRLQTIVPQERITRIGNMAWLQSGLFHSRSVHLTRIASKLPGRAKKLSRVRQIERLLANRHIQVRDWYYPVAAGLLRRAAATGGPLRLIIDGSKVGHGHQLLMVDSPWPLLCSMSPCLPLALKSLSGAYVTWLTEPTAAISVSFVWALTCSSVCSPTRWRFPFHFFPFLLETVRSLVGLCYFSALSIYNPISCPLCTIVL